MDCYYLTQLSSTLNQIEHIIQHTIHPLDNLSEIELTDVENKWFYVIFLQAVCRYLRLKEECSALDANFYYARDALLHYADWMTLNEYPYLEKPDILEFPNFTWAAQDIRKANILYCAAYFCPGGNNKYIERADYFKHYVITTLSAEQTSFYTRILSILMQNQAPLSPIDAMHSPLPLQAIKSYKFKPRTEKLTQALNIMRAILKAIRHFNIKRELNWLISRSYLLTRYTGNRK